MAEDDVAAIMTQEGLPGDEVAAWCAELQADPAYAAGRWAVQRLHKLESVLSMRQLMRDQSSVGGEIERVAGVSASDFLDEYYSANLPVILEDVCDEWPARSIWTPDYLVSKLGDQEVEVMDAHDADPRFEVSGGRPKRTMLFSAYVAGLLKAGWEDNLYLAANNRLLQSDAASVLWEDFDVDVRYLNPDVGSSSAFLWFGPGGTVTPLHHDVANVFLTQVVGEQHITLVSPMESHCVYNSTGVYSDVDLRSPDYSRFPKFAAVRQFEVTIGPGEALLIPVGWWHHVESLDLNISISFTNFVWPNQIHWSHPEIIY
jgi:hypothetical protein